MTNPWLDPDGRRFPDGAMPNNPLREAQIATLVRLATVRAPRRVLDLGCGPGYVARVLPGEEFVLVDASPAMLDAAREKMPGARVVCARLEDDWDVGAGFDLAVSVQAAHHLTSDDKRAFYRRVHAALAPGGLFLQSDPVAPDPSFLDHHTAIWNALRTNAGFEPLPADYDFDAHLERQGDLLEPLEDQLAWLRDAGFTAVDTFWRCGNRAIWGALR